MGPGVCWIFKIKAYFRANNLRSLCGLSNRFDFQIKSLGLVTFSYYTLKYVFKIKKQHNVKGAHSGVFLLLIYQ